MCRRALVPVLCFVVACSADGVDGARAPLAHPGPWAPAPEVLAYGNSITMPYDAAGPWDGGAHCGGGLLAGTRVLGDYLLAHFAAIDTYGGYDCRQNTADLTQMSVHGTGRALDLMISMDGTDADNDAGDPVAAWLVMHAVEVGVQYMIWDHEDWGGSRSVPKFRGYTGPIPHTDHIHVELTIAAAAMDAPWFMDAGTPDAGASTVDAGATTTDAGSPSTDAAPDADAASPTPTDDASSPAPDAGTAVPDHRLLRGGCAIDPQARAPYDWSVPAVFFALALVRRRRRS